MIDCWFRNVQRKILYSCSWQEQTFSITIGMYRNKDYHWKLRLNRKWKTMSPDHSKNCNKGFLRWPTFASVLLLVGNRHVVTIFLFPFQTWSKLVNGLNYNIHNRHTSLNITRALYYLYLPVWFVFYWVKLNLSSCRPLKWSLSNCKATIDSQHTIQIKASCIY